MAMSPSREAASRSATQEFPNILWSRMLHCRFQKDPPNGLYPEPDKSISNYPILSKSLIRKSNGIEVMKYIGI
jgi:hypothetical protein